ncbi:LysR family transcriptional regulator [Burkholderia arboris]|uniref:LysR family transcriptional regulator n=1 Tax=Burkholderia arboris TaxID=488730 RepID=A0A9Q9SLX8_9BURK|nr:LysR substrate-binding domain-containing protein [Burkholderia arboris]UTV60472.1 LysR substrate-binding domain-containing protein [Burkholderia arboris]VWC01529.1 LysR family transcriptional regulator [Burkholderia arboris]
MARRTLNYHQVELLYEVVRCRTLTAAARNLHISQPAVTKQLKVLEESLGVELFKREKGRLLPTAEAILLFEQTERTNASLHALNELADGLRAGTLGRLGICAYPAVTERLLPEAITVFQETYPKVFVEVAIENAERMLDLVESQQMDLGICAPFRAMRNVTEQHLLDSTIVCAMRADDPLATRQTVTLADLEAGGLTSVDALEGIPELEALLSASENRHAIHARVSSSALACRMVQLAGRRAIVDSLTAASIDATGLAFVPIETIPPRRIAMLRPSLRPGSAFTEAFCRILESQAKRLQADMTRRCARPRRVRAKR